jgi:hypothetical protein
MRQETIVPADMSESSRFRGLVEPIGQYVHLPLKRKALLHLYPPRINVTNRDSAGRHDGSSHEWDMVRKGSLKIIDGRRTKKRSFWVCSWFGIVEKGISSRGGRASITLNECF